MIGYIYNVVLLLVAFYINKCSTYLHHPTIATRIPLAARSPGSSASSPDESKRSPETKVIDVVDVVDYENVKPPAIFVDGYNIIGHMRNAEYGSSSSDEDDNVYSGINFEDARLELISDLSVLQSATGWYIEVVFDAYKLKVPQKMEVVSGICCVYTSAQDTADSYIERKFEVLKKQGFTNMVVASDDSMLRTVAGSTGIGFMSAANLVEELQIAYQGWTSVQEELNASADRAARPQGLSKDERISLQFALSQPSPTPNPNPNTAALVSAKSAVAKKDKTRGKYVSLQEFVATTRKRREEARVLQEALPLSERTPDLNAAAGNGATAFAFAGRGEVKKVDKKKDRYISVSDYLNGNTAAGSSSSVSGSSNINNNVISSKQNVIADINIKTQKRKSAKLGDRKIDISDFDFSADKKNGGGNKGNK